MTPCESPESAAAPADIFHTTMLGLEAGLRVAHIATRQLQTCPADADVREVLAEPRLRGFDAIPVVQDQRVVGVIQRTAEFENGGAEASMVPLGHAPLASLHGPLLQFILSRGTASYTLVVDEKGVCGIVTRSDLLKLPVRLLAFAFVTHLELLMRERIVEQSLPDGPSLLDLLSAGRRARLLSKLESLREQKLDPALVELTEFADKRDIVRQLLHLEDDFERDLKKVELLRNPLAHAATFATVDSDIPVFIDRLRAAERWIHRLQSS